MNNLSIDIETYCEADLKKTGLYRYVQDDSFEILLFAYSVDFGEVQIVDLAQGEHIPPGIIFALSDESVTKRAFNAAFEWYCLNTIVATPLNQWRDTMLQALYCGYPGALGTVAKALKLDDGQQKKAVGTKLINYFSKPCKPTKNNGNRTRNLPHHDVDKWQLFKDYNIQDVVVEMEVLRRFESFPVPEQEQRMWELDLQINAHGVAVDQDVVDGAQHVSDEVTDKLTAEAKEITGLSNPNSTAQLQKWLQEQGMKIDNLRKDTVADKIEESTGDVKRMLEIRKELSKTSVKKFKAMDAARCEDGRARGLLQHYGANRTGRWAGRLVQVQNLPKNEMDSLAFARNLVKDRATEALELIYGNVSNVLSELIRTAFVASHGHKLAVSDFSAIEARVIAWLAGEQWRLDVFATHGKIYEASASAMFNVPIEEITKGSPLRQKGKVSELALGYQGSKGALMQMGALDMGITEEELPDIVKRWRSANRRIVDLWYSLENAALAVMKTGDPVGVKGLLFAREFDIERGLDFLTIQLPSRRKLYYAKPFIAPGKFDQDAVHYYGLGENRQWAKIPTYGGKIVENVVQAIARDCLAEALFRVHNAGYQTVMHVHDEVVIDVPEHQADIKYLEEIMGVPMPWAPDLQLEADGFVTDFYQKD
ncbi:DNA polymerase [Geomicrobium sediminis]|uniref:DNA-directed DNA polymerase n=1 Tax=Geomicrobium sediminis TaxID=1347788 RepID=A0ABS2P6V8_9BACL|nr:DNA polymerase [Geomicrobium sediminis]MBM7631125.1 DNA polymerase [Geomicrobium sediminis]